MILRSRVATRAFSQAARQANRLTRHRVPPPRPRTSPLNDVTPAKASNNPPNGTYAWNSYNELPTEAAAEASASTSAIQTEIAVPHDEQGIIDNAREEPWAVRARKLFGSVPALVVVRQLEMMNVLIGYEEANRYRLCAPDGTVLGFLVEQETGFRGAMTRQMVGTHRAFKATILDPEGQVILTVKRPFSWINSRIFVCAPSESGREEDDDVVIGEVQQEWHLYRRRYNHFVSRNDEMVQFASTDAGLLAWNFYVTDANGATVASVNRNFSGLARELFTDTGQYVLRFEGVLDELADPRIESPPAPLALPASDSSSSADSDSTANPKGAGESGISSSVPAVIPAASLTYDQRAVLLASAVSIDFDYFTRSRGGMMPPFGMFLPIPMPGGGGTGSAEVPAEGGAGGGGTDGAVAGAGAGAVGGPVGPGTLDDTSLDSDDRLPPTYGSDDDDGDWRQGGGGGLGPSPDSGDTGAWSDEVMQDPWSNAGDAQEEGGTWGWSDLFPGDDE